MNKDLDYAFSNCLRINEIRAILEEDMVKVPEGSIPIGEKSFHVGAFKISTSLISGSCWNQICGDLMTSDEDKLVTRASFCQILSFLKRLNVTWKGAGVLTIPTEAQLELARRKGFIHEDQQTKEMCLTLYRPLEELTGHHFFDNVPKTKGDFSLVVRGWNGYRSSIKKCEEKPDVSFRLALVDYDYESDLEELIRTID